MPDARAHPELPYMDRHPGAPEPKGRRPQPSTMPVAWANRLMWLATAR